MIEEDCDGLPIHIPLSHATEGGVFGWDESGGLHPDRSQVRALTEEHAREMVAVLENQRFVEYCTAKGLDPVTGRSPRGKTGAERVERAERTVAGLTARYQDLLSAYAEGFGDKAAEELDQFVRGKPDGGGEAFVPKAFF